MKKIAFRVDISPAIGTGHFMRMNVLAEAFTELGCECTIYTGKDEPINYELYDIIVLDTYLLNDEYISSLRKPGRTLVCYDDNALYTYDCDILLNANFHAKELEFNLIGQKPKMLLGPEYALLRNEFRNAAPITINENAYHVLICFGGSDIRSFTPFVTKTLLGVPGLFLTTVLGNYTTCDNEVMSLASERTEILKAPNLFSEAMKRCDIAVTAAGSMVYELASMGLPSIVIPQADNQYMISDYLSRHGLMRATENWGTVQPQRLMDEVTTLLSDYPRRKAESAKLIKTVNPNGAVKAASEILKYSEAV